MNHHFLHKKASVIIAFLLIFLLSVSLFFVLRPGDSNQKYIADIYQNGILIQSVPLYEITTPQTIIVEGENDCVNTIELCRNSVAVLSADCPDKLCVKQGHIKNSKLPITCLPNRLVIQLRAVGEEKSNTITDDIITY